MDKGPAVVFEAIVRFLTLSENLQNFPETISTHLPRCTCGGEKRKEQDHK
jgi:hypothetical protein